MKQRHTGVPGSLSVRARIILVLLPIFTLLLCLCLGRISAPPVEFFRTLGARLGLCENTPGQYDQIFWSMRMPRLLLAMLVGAGLSVSGCVFQSLFANPLATPDTLGVASGASCGAALALLLGFGLAGLQWMATVFGIGAVGLTWLAASGKAGGRSRIVLAGIMIGSLFSALISLLKYVADPESQLPAITYWLMGSFDSASYETLLPGAIPIIGGIIVLLALRWRLNLLPLSEDEARTSGVRIDLLRAVCILCATAITASCVSMSGQVGWVGLLAPHVCRMKFGNNHLALLPACISLGAVFMMLVDTAARSVSAGVIPLSVLTAILGAPFFIVLMRRSGGWQL